MKERLELSSSPLFHVSLFSAYVWFLGSRKKINVKKFCSCLVIFKLEKERMKRIKEKCKYNLGVKIARHSLIAKGVSRQQ